MIIRPAKRLRGTLQLPGDKSISHRAAILSSLAESGTTRIENFSTSQDCESTLACLEQLGVAINRENKTTIEITAAGPNGFRTPVDSLNCGNSGSTMRLLAGALAGKNIEVTLTGDKSLRSRPMKRIIDPLTQMAAQVFSTNDRAPVTLKSAHQLHSIIYEMPVASAQVKSAVLLAALQAKGKTEIIEALPVTRDHTERMLVWLGVPVKTRSLDDHRAAIILPGPQRFAARNISVPGDISSAAFFIAAAALLPNSVLQLRNIGMNATRNQLLRKLHLFGVQIDTTNRRVKCNEPVGDIKVYRSTPLAPRTAAIPNTIRGAEVAQLIDELPILAVCGTQIRGGLQIRDAGELRVKESDRIAACVENLRAMGATVEEHEDGLTVAGPIKLQGARLDAHGDHRIAMAFTVAALIADGESELRGAECVAVSFPEFYELLESVVER